MTISALVTAEHADWAGPFVEDEIFGGHDGETVERHLAEFCRTELGSPPDTGVFYEVSVGSVVGLELADGRRVVKAHRPNVSSEFLEAAQHVQRKLAERGFPCPPPLLGPRPLGAGVATAEKLVDDGERRDAHDPAVREAMAEQLARLVGTARDLASTPGLRTGRLSRLDNPGGLWPEPHSRLFDFAATASGAEWIDELAHRARAVLAEIPAGSLVLGHGDWSVKHFRFLGDDVGVIYDWDSLTLNDEPVLVGEAARGFTMTWYLDVPVIPTVVEARAFVAEYEEARGCPFGRDERRRLGAAAAYALAYTARCEACLDGASGDFPPGSARRALAVHGHEFLSL